ncbi:EAL domain-containing protein [Klebsiella aerogenes]
MRNKLTSNKFSSTMTFFENEFISGLLSGAVYPVFQPIVNKHHKILGFEILLRWNINGKEISAGEFIDRIKSTNSHAILAEFLIRTAIYNISKYNGRLFFSVNITSINIIVTEILYNIILSMREKICRKEWMKKLNLEFAEHLDFYKDSRIAYFVKRLLDLNVTIDLDDCFSKKSVHFPTRDIKFTGYKLDKTITSNFIHDSYDSSLIRSLLYFCILTGSTCTAEGIENYNTMFELCKLGVSRFQGYWISKPVPINELDNLIRLLGII